MAELFTSTLNTLTLPEFTDTVERMFVDHTKLIVPQARQLFKLDPIGLNNGDSRVYDEVDGETFASIKPEGVDAAKAKAGIGYEQTASIRRFGKEIDVTWEMRNFNKVPQVVSKLKELRDFVPQREELDLTHRLTFMTSTSFTDQDGNSNDVSMGDGFALAYSAHTLAGSSTTYRNRVSGDPIASQGALESALSLSVSDCYSNLGERRVWDFDVVYSTDDPATVREIKQLLLSSTDVTQDNPGVVNTHQGRMLHVVLPYLATTATSARDATKRKWWGIVATGQWHAYFGQAEPAHLISPKSGNNGEDMHNDNWTYGTRGAYLIAIVSGRGFIGSCPTSA